MFKNLFGRDQERELREKKLQETVADLQQQLITQKNLNIRHLAHIKDIGNQNEELRKAITITPQEKAAYDNQTQVLIGYQNDQNRLAFWLRDNKHAEITAGKHTGMDLIAVILMYLGGSMASQPGKEDITSGNRQPS